MSCTRTELVQELFAAALELDEPERAAFLASRCGEDETLRAEVVELLVEADRLPDAFLAPPRPAGLGLSVFDPADAAEEQAAKALVGTRVGRFELLRLLAAGGMGVVYEARQAHPRRTVALKLMKPGLASAASMRRFVLEAEVLGRLRHPNIAQVYDAGIADTSRGSLPYFALEYVENARPLTTYADEAGLDTRQRLELFARVCDAVHHGHVNGVIHRDLKPANILVGADGQPKLIDYGVARLARGESGLTTAHTLGGQIIGTVQYMSPEQCEGDPATVDTRSDVYSLGVVLYELLTGALPYHASGLSLAAATRTISEQPPARPSTINRKLRGDVETVVLKALEKRPDRRYDSADALARDIRRVLKREPIAARRPTPLDRAARWAMRHPIVVTVVLCLVLIAVTGTSIALTYWYAMIRPDHVELVSDRRAAVLRSGAGIELHRWGADAVNAVQFARDVKAAIGGTEKHLAIVGFKNAPGLEYEPGVCVFDCNGRRDRPLWAGRLEPNDVPVVLMLRDRRLFTADNFSARRLAVADVFDPPAGQELIVAHQHDSYTQTALRIYALADGEVLWQVWMDFDVGELFWLSQPGVLIVAGLEGRVYWEQRSETRGMMLLRSFHPTAVLAIRPQPGCRLAHYVAPDHPLAQLRPRWVKCLLPTSLTERVGTKFAEALVPGPAGLPGQVVQVSARDALTEDVSVAWDFDGDGPLADARPRYTGNYVVRTTLPRDDPHWVPSPERIDADTGKPEIYWGDLPDIQWFPADDKQLDPVTRDLQLHFGVDPTLGKPRRGSAAAPAP